MAPLISVVMPVMNPHPVYFREAVQSILSQTVADLELVIVEDPSPASAAGILKDFDDPRIRHHRNPSRTSLVAQRNLALELAAGEWMALLDADDISEPNRFADQLAYLNKHPEIDVLGCQLTIIDHQSRVIGYRPYLQHHEQIAKAMRRFNSMPHSALFFRRQLLIDMGGYRYERYPCGEDYELYCRLITRGVRFGNHPDWLIRYRIQSNQLKLRKLREHILCTVDIKRMYWKREFDFGDRLRLWAEKSLLAMPDTIVFELFRRLQYQRARPT